MASLVSSFLHHSANKIDHFTSNKKKSGGGGGNASSSPLPYGQLHQATLSTPIFPTTQGFYQHQASQSAEWLSPPPYDPSSSSSSSVMSTTPPSPPIMTPSSSWTTTSHPHHHHHRRSSSVDPNAIIMDRRSISQGMKLVSIAADEYDEGNEEVALDIYLTGLDKILMALPNKTDTKTKLALREKLLSVEERVGILTLAHQYKEAPSSNQQQQQQQQQQQDTFSSGNSLLDALILQKISQTWQSVTNPSSLSTAPPPPPPPSSSSTSAAYRHPYQQTSTTTSSNNDSITIEKFKQLSHAVIQASATLAILIKQSPIPALLGFCFHYVVCLMVWVDAHYGVRRRAHAFGMQGLKVMLDTNEQYRLHEYVTELVFMLVTATLKAVVAYRETPRHPIHIVELQEEDAVMNEEVMVEAAPISSSSSSLSSSSSVGWLWSVATSSAAAASGFS